MSVIDKIKSCKTMRELDELRIEVIVAAQNGEMDIADGQKDIA